MPTITLDDMVTPLTTDEVKESIYNVLAALGTNTTTWKPGAVVRTIISASAIVISAFSQLVSLIARSGWLELATGEWLRLVAIFVYGIDPTVLDETFAAGEVTFNNAGGGVYGPFAVGDVIVANGTTGKTYRNTSTFSIAALQTGVVVQIEAVEAGAASTSAPGEINTLVTTMVGVSVTNAAAVVGLDAKSETETRTLCLEHASSLSPNGPRDAYAYFARTAVRQDGTLVGVTRVAVSKSSTTGQVMVTVANATGGISGIATDPTTDLGAVDFALRQNVVPDAVTLTTLSATSLTINVTYEVWVYSSVNMTTPELQSAISDRLIEFMSTQPIGGNVIGGDPGKVFRDAIQTTIEATRVEIFHVVLTLPGGDVVLAATQIPELGAVTCTAVHFQVNA